MTNSAPNPFSLVGRVALVTGSTTALGKVGAKVALNFNNNVARTEKAFAEFKAVGCEMTIVRCDVSSETDVPRFVAEIAAKLGPVDILVLNATPDQPQKPIEEYEWAFYQQVLDFSVKSPVLLSKACLPHMKAQTWGIPPHSPSPMRVRGGCGARGARMPTQRSGR